MPRNGKYKTRSIAPNQCVKYESTECIQDVFARRLREERHRKELSREQLAELADISIDTVKRYENGTMGMRLDVAYKIACVLGVPLQDLLPQREYELTRVVEEFESVLTHLKSLNK